MYPKRAEEIAETLSEVLLVDYRTSINPIPNVACGWNGFAANTLGDYQYYRDYPKPDNLDRLPLIAHETVHSFHKTLMGDSTGLFLIGYLGDSATAQIYDGDGYHHNMSEIHAYAIGKTVLLLLDDPKFKSAVETGSTGQLPREYRDKVRLHFNEQMAKRLRK